MNKVALLVVLVLACFACTTMAQCSICELIVGYGESFLSSNSSEQEVEKFLDNVVCTLFGPIKSDCELLVNSYYPELVDYIVKNEDPQKACTQLGVCNSTEIKPLLTLQKVKPMISLKPKAPGADAGCTICTILFELAEAELSKNATEQEVEDFLENKVCALLPSVFGQECDNLVSQYLPALVEEIEAQDPPNVACAKLKLCNATKEMPLLKLQQVPVKKMPLLKLQVPVKKMPLLKLQVPVKPMISVPPKDERDGAGCTICEAVVGIAENLVLNNATTEDIEGILDEVCKFLPEVLTSECDDLVDQYIPALVNYIKEDEDPQVACTQIGLCESAKKMPLLKLKQVTPKN